MTYFIIHAGLIFQIDSIKFDQSDFFSKGNCIVENISSFYVSFYKNIKTVINLG